MIGVGVRAIVHSDCGQSVFLVDGELFEPRGAEHLCQDYRSWHSPPDRRDPADLDVPDGWRPRVWAGQAEAA